MKRSFTGGPVWAEAGATRRVPGAMVASIKHAARAAPVHTAQVADVRLDEVD